MFIKFSDYLMFLSTVEFNIHNLICRVSEGIIMQILYIIFILTTAWDIAMNNFTQTIIYTINLQLYHVFKIRSIYTLLVHVADILLCYGLSES